MIEAAATRGNGRGDRMPDKPDDNDNGRPDLDRVTWGPRLFLGAVHSILFLLVSGLVLWAALYV